MRARSQTNKTAKRHDAAEQNVWSRAKSESDAGSVRNLLTEGWLLSAATTWAVITVGVGAVLPFSDVCYGVGEDV
jgi:hypothetical protein